MKMRYLRQRGDRISRTKSFVKFEQGNRAFPESPIRELIKQWGTIVGHGDFVENQQGTPLKARFRLSRDVPFFQFSAGWKPRNNNRNLPTVPCLAE